MESFNVCPFRVWLLSFSIISSRFIHEEFHFFLWLNNISLWYISHFTYVFICWWTQLFPSFGCCEYRFHEHWGTSIWVSPCFLLAMYIGVELLGHTVILCLTFWGAAKLFPAAATFLPFYFLGSVFWRTNVFNFYEVHCIFCLVDWIFAVMFKKSLPNPGSGYFYVFF